ncbi:MAG: type II secretion system F family protein [Candidatus Moranbacteria bacterium]|nr:type II secretion system F family protein [Candidatus Moranbacteria bacterium]
MFGLNKDKKDKKTDKKSEKKKRKKFSRFLALGVGKEKEYFVENLSMLMASGMNISAALKAIKKEVRASATKKMIKEMLSDVEAGYSLSSSLERTRIFSDYTVSLIKIGEESGRLSENLKVIAEQEQKDRIFKGKIKSAMMYPVLVMVLAVTIGIGIAWFILPRLSNVFAQLDMELPLITKVLIGTGQFLGDYGKIAIPSFVIGISLLIYFIFFFSKTKFIGQSILFILPGAKNLVKETELARFGYLLGTLLEAGLPVVSALKSLANATPFWKYQRLFNHMKKEMQEGNSFKKCFASYKKSNKLIPSTVQQMIVSGEKSGMLSDTLKKIGRTYEGKTENTTKNLTVLLEPVMLVIVWLGVVAVALAVILPIYSLVGGLNESAGINSSPPAAEEQIEKEAPEEQIEKEAPEKQASEKAADEEDENPKVKILETGLGFLNVRRETSLESEVITRVVPGEEYENIGQRNDWYQIIYEQGEDEEDKTGWVFGEYVQMVQETSSQESTEQESDNGSN